MTQAMKIGNVSVMPGEVGRGGIPIGADMFPRGREIPLIVVRGAADGPVLWAERGDARR